MEIFLLAEIRFSFWLICFFLVSCYATLHPALSVGLSVCHTLLFLWFFFLGPHCSCPNDLVTSILAPAHPHATGVAVYPALFFIKPYYCVSTTNVSESPHFVICRRWMENATENAGVFFGPSFSTNRPVIVSENSSDSLDSWVVSVTLKSNKH